MLSEGFCQKVHVLIKMSVFSVLSESLGLDKQRLGKSVGSIICWAKVNSERNKQWVAGRKVLLGVVTEQTYCGQNPGFRYTSVGQIKHK